MAKDLSHIVDRVTFTVGDGEDGMRIDHFLAEKVAWRSRTELQERVKSGIVKLNDQAIKPSHRVKKGDSVVIFVRPRDLPNQNPADIPIEIIYEDDAIVVVHKQAGLMVHPAGLHVYDTLMNALWLRYKSMPNATEPHVVHRLDKDTSGVLVVARTAEAKQRLQRHFEDRGPKKSYLALCAGVVKDDAGTIDLPMDRDEKAAIKLKMAVLPGGMPSLTTYEVVERFAAHTLVRAEPHTGRQHQIRVHLAAIGHPILVDALYGDPRSVGKADGTELLLRQGLHAERLSFDHPMTRQRCTFTAPLAKDMAAVVDHLRTGAPLAALIDRQSQKWRIDDDGPG